VRLLRNKQAERHECWVKHNLPDKGNDSNSSSNNE